MSNENTNTTNKTTDTLDIFSDVSFLENAFENVQTQTENKLADYLQLVEGQRIEIKFLADAGLRRLQLPLGDFVQVSFQSKIEDKTISYYSPKSLNNGKLKDAGLFWKSAQWNKAVNESGLQGAAANEYARKDPNYLAIKRKQKKQIYAFVISDSANKDNNGKIKIFTIPYDLYKVVSPVKPTQDAAADVIEDYNNKKKKIAALYTFGDQGRSLIIRVTKKGQFNTFEAEFNDPKKVALTEENQKTLDNFNASGKSVVDLHKIATSEEAEELFNRHFLLQNSSAPVKSTENPTPTPSTVVVKEKVTPIRATDESDIDDILNSL